MKTDNYSSDIMIGFNTAERPIEDYLDYAGQYGINHLEIDLIKEHSRLTVFDSERINYLKMQLENRQISVSLHTPYSINPADRRHSTREGTITYLTQCIILAAKLNATHLTTHIGFFFGMPLWRRVRQQALNRLADSLTKVMHYCESYGIIMALENAVPKILGSDFYFLGDNINDFNHLFSTFQSPHLKMCLDIGHAHISEGIFKYIDTLAEQIVCVHYHDNHGRSDEHLGVGEGTIPWKQVITALKKKNFTGPFIAECLKIEPHEAVNRLISYF